MLNKLSFNLMNELNESETRTFKIKKKVFMESDGVKEETLTEDASSALDKIISGDEVYFRDPQGRAMIIKYTNNYPEPEDYDEGYKEEYGGSADELEYAKKAAEEGNVWEALEVDEEGNPTGVSIALFYGEEELRRMLEDLREVNVIKKLEEGENTFKYVYYPDEIKEMLLNDPDFGLSHYSDAGFDSEEEMKNTIEDDVSKIKRIESEVEVSKIPQTYNDSYLGFKSGKVRTILKDGRAFISTEPEISLIYAVELVESTLEESALNEGKENKLNESVFEIDYAGDGDLSTERFVINNVKEWLGNLANEVKVEVVELHGPGGGWPVVRLTGDKEKIGNFLNKEFNSGIDSLEDTYDLYLVSESALNEGKEDRLASLKMQLEKDGAQLADDEKEAIEEEIAKLENELQESEKSLKEDSYEEDIFQDVEEALDNAGFRVERYSDAGVMTKNLGWIIRNSNGELHLTCAGSWLDESEKPLKEEYYDKLGGDSEDFVSDVTTIKEALEAIDTRSFGTYLAQEMVEEFISTCEYQIERGNRLTKGEFGESEKVEIKEVINEADGWIAFYNGDKVEITKDEAKDLWGAKQVAIQKLKVPKSKVSLLAVEPAYNESAINEEAEMNVKDLQVIKEQGNVYMLEDKSDGKKYIVGENYNLSEGEIENAEVYENKEDADKDYLDRCDIIKTEEEPKEDK